MLVQVEYEGEGNRRWRMRKGMGRDGELEDMGRVWGIPR